MAVSAWTETAMAQRAAIAGNFPKDTIWLNANENPAGPPASAIEAMTRVLPETGRYHYQEFREFYASVARSEDLNPDQVLVGAGSSEILHAVVDAFTSETRPLIYAEPTYELPMMVARALNHALVGVPLTPAYAADVKGMVAAADQHGGGVVYLCNPNNPTSSVTPKKDIDWMIANLPPNTVALIDEAYIHFSESPDLVSAISHVKQGKNVVVSRTFSKIYGMAGLRIGFGCAKPEFIEKMAPFRDNVVSIVGVRAVLAALAEASTLIPERKAKLARTRRELCEWLQKKGLRYIEPSANFMMIDVGRDVREITMPMLGKGVAVGRQFPPYTNMMRVSIGTDAEMEKFRQVFSEVYPG